MTHPHAAETATARVRHVLRLTEQLSARLADETRAFEARRPQDVAAGQAETQGLANAYRRESAQIRADPSALRAAPLAERQALARATRVFETILAEHSQAVEAARIVSEGLVRTIAAEIAASRPPASAYGASGHAAQGDARAVALNRTA